MTLMIDSKPKLILSSERGSLGVARPPGWVPVKIGSMRSMLSSVVLAWSLAEG